MGDEWIFIVNPASGRGRSARAARQSARILQGAGHSVEIRLTQRPGHAGQLAARAVQSGCRHLAVCGGDGTIAEVLPAARQGDIALGILPFGTANDLARALRIPRRVDAATDILLTGHTDRIDLGRANGRPFATVAAFGFDAEVNQMVARGRLGAAGSLGYVGAALWHLARFRPPRVRVSGDFGHLELEVVLVAVGNTRSYGGGMQITPEADPRDGELDVCIVRRVRRRTVAVVLPRLFTGGHVRHPAVRMERSRWIRIDCLDASPRVVYADGERLGQSPLYVDTMPRALRLILPASLPR